MIGDQNHYLSLLAPADRLDGAGVDSFLAVAGTALVRTDHLGLFIYQLKDLGTDFCTMSTPDTEVLVYYRRFCHESSFPATNQPISSGIAPPGGALGPLF
jgi:hypothetical protein